MPSTRPGATALGRDAAPPGASRPVPLDSVPERWQLRYTPIVLRYGRRLRGT